MLMQRVLRKNKKINFNLSHSNWIYVFWNDKILGKELRLKKAILLELMGKSLSSLDLDNEIKRVYKLNNKKYKTKIKPV